MTYGDERNLWENVVRTNRCNGLSHLAQKGMVVGVLVSRQRMLSRIPPGVEQAPKGHYQLLRWNWGTPKPFDLPWWDAKMRAYGTEGGGGVVAQCLAVMARTR